MIKQDYRLKIFHYGDKLYYYKHEIHRLGRPARICPDGHQSYYVNGRIHRLDGPAIIWSNGSQYYYVNDQWIPEKDFYQNYYQKKND